LRPWGCQAISADSREAKRFKSVAITFFHSSSIRELVSTSASEVGMKKTSIGARSSLHMHGPIAMECDNGYKAVVEVDMTYASDFD